MTDTSKEAVDAAATSASKAMAEWIAEHASDEGSALWNKYLNATQAWGKKNAAEHAALYHHNDTVTALQAEVDRLREALRDIAEPKVGPDVDWSKEEANAWRAGRWRWAQSRARAALSGDDI